MARMKEAGSRSEEPKAVRGKANRQGIDSSASVVHSLSHGPCDKTLMKTQSAKQNNVFKGPAPAKQDRAHTTERLVLHWKIIA